jgi:hypothetical protein
MSLVKAVAWKLGFRNKDRAKGGNAEKGAPIPNRVSRKGSEEREPNSTSKVDLESRIRVKTTRSKTRPWMCGWKEGQG